VVTFEGHACRRAKQAPDRGAVEYVEDYFECNTRRNTHQQIFI
jgi:hypothetical protein